ncbi:glycosyltransferase family 87 protein [Sphingomonas abietis]|uniref:Glycosyltransferase family 87 protein n=1 Tax=Sphingomonas abietis TaxID=3012344 RepID=A0ABY7NK93_9SPHN|nr:glycosyltransferase family 87 protein [Sphingomonas abietis]WBO21939.1 glycosyltransferase family 87 protein [Sphingomonas abietis]
MNQRGEQRATAQLLGFGLLFWALYLAYALHETIVANDFGVFFEAAHDPLAMVYQIKPSNPFVYPPMTLVWLKPLALLGWTPALILWVTLSLGGMAWATYRLTDTRIALLVLASPVMATTLAVGQFGAIVGAMILWAVRCQGWRQGVLLGLAATIKPQILLAAPIVLLFRADWRALLGAALSMLAMVMLELVTLGPKLWIAWRAAITAFPQGETRIKALAGSVSPAGIAQFHHLPALPFLLAGTVLALLWLRKRARAAGPVELAALIVSASMLMSPYMLVYDLTAMAPFVAVQLIGPSPRDRIAALAAFVCPFLGAGVLWLAARAIWSRDTSPLDPHRQRPG